MSKKKKIVTNKMISLHDTASLIYVKSRTLQVESELEECINQIARKRRIDFERPNDYSHRVFSMVIPFDQINIEFFDEKHIEKIKKLYVEYVSLRKKVRPLEKEYDIKVNISKQLKNDVRGSLL